jgi:hypothetical protein
MQCKTFFKLPLSIWYLRRNKRPTPFLSFVSLPTLCSSFFEAFPQTTQPHQWPPHPPLLPPPPKPTLQSLLKSKLPKTHHLHLFPILLNQSPNSPRPISWYGTINLRPIFMFTISMGSSMVLKHHPTHILLRQPMVSPSPLT